MAFYNVRLVSEDTESMGFGKDQLSFFLVHDQDNAALREPNESRYICYSSTGKSVLGKTVQEETYTLSSNRCKKHTISPYQS